MAGISKRKLAQLEKVAQETQAFAPVAAAMRYGKRYSDLTEDQQDMYARFMGYGSGKMFAALLLQLAEIGVGEGLDEPLRKPSQFRTEAERAEHIQKVAAEIQHILDGDADG